MKFSALRALTVSMVRQRILLLTISISFIRPLTAAMTEAVADVNAEHLRALEDALNVMFAHPILESIQSMPPAPIRGDAESNEAGSQVSRTFSGVGFAGI